MILPPTMLHCSHVVVPLVMRIVECSPNILFGIFAERFNSVVSECNTFSETPLGDFNLFIYFWPKSSQAWMFSSEDEVFVLPCYSIWSITHEEDRR